MSDINPSTPPSPDASAAAATASTAPVSPGNPATSMGLEPNVAAGIAAIFGIISSTIVFFVEKKNTFVRFWAAQLMVFWAGAFVFNVAFGIVTLVLGRIPVVGGLLSLVGWVISLAFFAFWIFTLIKTFSGKEWKIPYVSQYAEKLIAKFPATAA